MTNHRNYTGGGSLTPGLYTLPKGGVEHDRAKHGGSMPVQDRRLPMHREPHASCCELARHKLGTPTGPDADGGQRHLPRGQRGRRGTAYADRARDTYTLSPAPRMGVPNRRRLISAICTNYSLRRVRQHEPYDPSSGRRSAAQQPAPLPFGAYLASDGLSPERGCAA